MRSASCNTARSGRERHKRTHVVVRSPSSSSPRHSPPEPEAIAVDHGDITVADTRSGDRFHLTVTLQAPGHALTTVTHRALQRTVRGLLQRRAPAAGSASASSVQLTIDGVVLSESGTVTVPNGAVVEVHRTAHGRRSLSSAVAPSEREVSIRSPPHDTTRTGPRRAAPQRNKSASPPHTVATANARAAIATKRLASPCSPAAAAAAASPPTRRLPLRRAADTRSVSRRLPTSPGSDAAAHVHPSATSTAHTSKGLRRGPAGKDASSTATSPHDFEVMKPQAAFAASHSPTATGSSRGGGAHTTSTGTSNTCAGHRSVSPIQHTASVRSANDAQPPPRQEQPLRPASSSRHGSFSDDAHEGTRDRTPTESYSADTTALSSGDSTTGPGDGAAAPRATPDMPSPPAHASPTPRLPRAEHAALQTAEQTVTTAAHEAQRLPLTSQEVYAAQRSAIAAAAAAEQRRVLTRLQHHCRALEEEKRALLTTRLAALKAQESAVRLRTLRAAQEAAATAEADDVRVRLGEHRDALLSRWLRVLHAHARAHYAMPTPLLRELEDEGDGLTLHCLSSIAAHHTQRARLQALRQQRVLQETAVARLRWEAHVRRCTAEEGRGCLRVVAQLRPPSRRAWLPASVVASGAVAEMDGGYAVRVVPAATAAASMREVELVDPPRNVRRRYTVWAAYDAAAAPSPTRGAATAPPPSPPLPPLPQQLFKEQLQPLLAHMCRTGQHVAVLAFGAVGSGKTHTLLGPRAIALPPASASTTPAGKPRTAAVSPPAPATGARLDARSSSSSSSDLDTYDSAGDSGGVNGDNDVTPPTGITRAGPQEPLGITRCLDPADAAVEAAVMQSVAAAEAAVRQRHVDARDACEEREWRTQAGITAEDGLLPRAVAWLTAHLRDAAPRGAVGTADTAVVESLRMSVYEVYDDHVYDLLPTPPPAGAKGSSDDGKPAWAARPRWNPGWLPGPHVKNSNPEQLTELQLELAPASTPATVSQLLQQAAPPQWRVRASEVAVRSASEALRVLQLGLHRRRTAAVQRSATSSRSHLYVRFRVEVQRPVMPGKASCTAAAAVHALERGEAAPPASGEGLEQPKGYGFLRAALAASSADAEANIGTAAAPSLVPPTCIAELLFADFAGSERVELGGHAGEALREAQGIHASLSAVADVLTALARANPRRQEQRQQQQQQTPPEPAARQRTATLVAHWGAATTRPGITLARGPPVFLQPRLAPAGSRSRAEGDGAVTLRRRVLTLMDTHVAADAAVQWWRQWRSAAPYVPFRACKTTQLLQSTLGAPCKTLVLACVRPCSVTEVVLPASPHDRAGGPRLRATATAVFAHQAPAMLSETHATLDLAARLHDAAQGDGTDDEKAAARRRQ